MCQLILSENAITNTLSSYTRNPSSPSPIIFSLNTALNQTTYLNLQFENQEI
jgi:hypothetical protein